MAIKPTTLSVVKLNNSLMLYEIVELLTKLLISVVI